MLGGPLRRPGAVRPRLVVPIEFMVGLALLGLPDIENGSGQGGSKRRHAGLNCPWYNTLSRFKLRVHFVKNSLFSRRDNKRQRAV
jgi:hypothetical protein